MSTTRVVMTHPRQWSDQPHHPGFTPQRRHATNPTVTSTVRGEASLAHCPQVNWMGGSLAGVIDHDLQWSLFDQAAICSGSHVWSGVSCENTEEGLGIRS